jgi:uncharacterized membrane protein
MWRNGYSKRVVIMNDVKTIGTILVSVLVVIGFILSTFLAYQHDYKSAIDTLNGVFIAAVMSVVGFWVGSSVGSRAKDEIIARNHPVSTIRRPEPPMFPKTP